MTSRDFRTVPTATRPAFRLYLVAVILPTVAVALAGLVATVRANPAPSPRVCFPRAAWANGTVPDRFRPCARIVRVAEDGSFRFAVSDADGTVRYSGSVGALDR